MCAHVEIVHTAVVDIEELFFCPQSIRGGCVSLLELAVSDGPRPDSQSLGHEGTD